MNTHKAKLPVGLRILTLICLAVSTAGPQRAAGAENASPAGLVRVSVDSGGRQANGGSYSASISADGRFVAFQSQASNLITGDTNGRNDIFVHDCETGTTERVSTDSSGREANWSSMTPSISADGRYVAFVSDATNLVSEDTNGESDVFIHDRQTGNTALVSVSSNGSHGNKYSNSPSISDDGRYVAFLSAATNLVDEDTNLYMDAYVHDLQTGETTLVSVDSNGLQANGASWTPDISADGRYVVFNSSARNQVTRETIAGSQTYVHDRQTGATSLVSVSSDGTIGISPSTAPSISADGRYAAFSSGASNPILGVANGNGGIFVHNLKTGATALVYSSGQTGDAIFPSISGDGRSVAFIDYTNSNSDIFSHDRATGNTTLLSVNSSGDSRDGSSSLPSMASNGLSVAFESYASNLVPGDTNEYTDIFVSSWAPLPSFNLAVTWTGSGSGNVTSSPDGIDCSFACSSPFPQGIAVSLTAAANIGSYFTGWSGAATGTANPIDVIMNADKSVSADFALYEYTLAVRSDHGTVTRSPDQASYHYGDVVELTAAPDPGYSFAYWSEDADGYRNPIQVTIRGDTAVSANYIQGGRTLTVSSDHGTVARSPDQAAYQDGGAVQLTASADAGWAFDHWSGAVSGTSNPVDVTIHGDTSVTANYILAEYNLKIVSEHGTVTRVPDQATYHYGDVVHLTAAANALYLFSNWSGDAASRINPLDITIQGDTHLTANYSVNTDKRYVAPGGDDGASCLTPSEPCGTINGAIGKASSGDTIYVAIGIYTGSTSAAVVTIDRTLTISLSGGWDAGFTSQTGMSVIDGQNFRQGLLIYQVDTSVLIHATLENFTIQNGYASFGGGIRNYDGLTINHGLIKNNFSAMMGGGIASGGSLTLNDTIVKDNSAVYGGGGISASSVILNDSLISGNSLSFSIHNGSAIESSETLTLNNTTVSGNSGGESAIHILGGSAAINSSTIVENEGKGIFIDGGILRIRNSIVAWNPFSDLYNDPYYGVVESLGYNLIRTHSGFTLASTDLSNLSPRLGPLQDNGGPTLTHALGPGSPAINAGDPGGCQGSAGLLITDGRGYPRVGRCDIGAFEVNPLDFSVMMVTPDRAPAGSTATYTITLTNTGTVNIDPISVTDVLPDSLAYQDGSLTVTGGNASQAAGVIAWTGPVNAGSQVIITFRAEVSQSARGTVISNEALIESASGAFRRTAVINVPPPWLTFVPLVNKPIPGIHGHVTVNGKGIYGILLELRCFNGAYWYTLASTNTDTNGNYQFLDLLSLSPGQTYYIRFTNPGDPTYLSLWHTRSLTSYTTGDSVHMDDFDIANVPLVSPEAGATVALPVTFTWMPRAATPDDSYQFELFDPSGSSDFLSPLLGYVDSYRLKSRPTGFGLGKTYGWAVWVNSPDGGYGASYYYNPITFKAKGLSLFPFLTGTAQPKLLERGDERHPQIGP